MEFGIVGVGIVVVGTLGIVWLVVRRRRSDRANAEREQQLLDERTARLRSLLEAATTSDAIERVRRQIVPGTDDLTWEGFELAQGLSAMVADHEQKVLLNETVDELISEYRKRHARLLLAVTDSDRLSALGLLEFFWTHKVDWHKDHGRTGLTRRLLAIDQVMSHESVLERMAEIATSYQRNLVARAASDEQAFWELLYLFYSIRRYNWAELGRPIPVPNSYSLKGSYCEWSPVSNWVELVGKYLDCPDLYDLDLTVAALGTTEFTRSLAIHAMAVKVLKEGTRAEAKLVLAYLAADRSLVPSVGVLFQSAIGWYANNGELINITEIMERSPA